MKKTLMLSTLALMSLAGFAQKRTTTSALVSFDATTEKDALPRAENKTVVAALNQETGALAFEAQVKGFNFTNAMIQEHFNGAKWLDSKEYPTFYFAGEILDVKSIKLGKNGTYDVQVKGQLTLHGVTQDIITPAQLLVKDGKIHANANFSISLADYKINNSAKGKVADQPKISVTAVF